jgi:hypothetical protein
MRLAQNPADVGRSMEIGKPSFKKVGDAPQDGDDSQYPTPGRTWIVMGCLYVTIFLVALVSCLSLCLVSQL